jgi:subtilisin family serine protease
MVNSAGNEGNTAWRKVIPPADGDSVIAAGGVSPFGLILANSSRGPTADGRIKPDFCAQGSGVYAANWRGGYLPVGGTSYAAPLLSGSIVLLMEAHPSWAVADILENMKSYSIRPPVFNHLGPQSVVLGETLNLRITVDFLPNNNYGWGIPDFNEVVNLPDDWYGDDIVLIFATSLGAYADTETVRILILDELGSLAAITAPHPAVDSAVFRISPGDLGPGNIYIHDVSGALIREIDFESVDGNFIRIIWDGKDGSGDYVASGVYILNVSLGGSTVTEKFVLVSSR